MHADRDLVLDFWRGVGVSMVLLHHLVYFHFGFFRSAGTALPGLLGSLLEWGNVLLVEFSERSGPWGVRIFFIVSGFIITHLMLREERARGTLDVKAFYLRRFFRIVPAYAVYLLAVFAFSSLGWIGVSASELAAGSGFVCNTSLACGWFTVHTWTLAVEMQFYLIWPIIFVLLPAHVRPYFLAALFAFLLTLSAAGLFVARGWIDNASAFACISLGALCAVVPALRDSFERHTWRWLSGCALAIGGLYFLGSEEPARLLYRAATPFILASLIFGTYRFPRLIVSRPFAAVAAIGLVSYSLYLWQQAFAAPMEEYLSPSLLEYSLLMVVFTLASYFLVEKPCIRFGKKLLQKRTLHAKV